MNKLLPIIKKIILPVILLYLFSCQNNEKQNVEDEKHQKVVEAIKFDFIDFSKEYPSDTLKYMQNVFLASKLPKTIGSLEGEWFYVLNEEGYPLKISWESKPIQQGIVPMHTRKLLELFETKYDIRFQEPDIRREEGYVGRHYKVTKDSIQYYIFSVESSTYPSMNKLDCSINHSPRWDLITEKRTQNQL